MNYSIVNYCILEAKYLTLVYKSTTATAAEFHENSLEEQDTSVTAHGTPLPRIYSPRRLKNLPEYTGRVIGN